MTRFFTTVCAALLIGSVASAQVNTEPLTANQWIQPTEAGALSGRVIVPSGNGTAQSVEGASVTISSVDGGGFVSQAVTNGMGEFTIPGVTPGVYTLTARAANVYARTAVHIIDSGVDLGGRYTNVAEISAANMGFDAVYSTIDPYRPPSNNRIISMANADLDALAGQVNSEETYRVAQFDGGLNGRILAAGADGPNLIPASMTNVFIMRNGVEVGRAVTDELGDFRVDNVPVGSYALLAVGRDGIAAIGFELIEQGAGVALKTADGKQLVAKVKAANSFGCQLSPLGDGEDGEGDGEGEGEGLPFMDGFGGGYYGGGGGAGGGAGGGGGGGGGGSFGGIAGLAGIGGIIAAIAGSSDGNGGIGEPPTASDFLPPGFEDGPFPPGFPDFPDGFPDSAF